MARFEPGWSGNPSGRPRGSKNQAAKLLETFEDDLPALLAVTKEKALQVLLVLITSKSKSNSLRMQNG